jgi:hypothetical protein
MSDDASILAKGLGGLKRCVGNTPDAGAYAFTTLELSSDAEVKVTDLSSVTKFTELTKVSLSNQAIADVMPLASLPYLAEIVCKNNKLTRSLDALAFRLCKAAQDSMSDTGSDVDAAWASGDRSIGSVLNSVDLSFNLIPGPLGDHSLHRFLRRLNLANNVLGEVGEGLSGLLQLKYLNLSGNKLKRVEPRELPEGLTELDVSSNDLREIAFVSSLQSLEAIVVDQNRVTSTEALSDCPELRVVSIRNNALAEIRCIEDLEECENLQGLSIEGNPLSAVDFVRLRVISMLPQLTSLEGKMIVSEERVKSVILLGNDHPRRMHTWEKHLSIPFVDTVPMFDEDEDDDRMKIEEAVRAAAQQAAGSIAQTAIGNLTPRKE